MVMVPTYGSTAVTVFELTAVVHEGRHFPADAALQVVGTFDAEERGTGTTRAGSGGAPVWGGGGGEGTGGVAGGGHDLNVLTWRRDADQVRRLQAAGAKLKLTGARGDGSLPQGHTGDPDPRTYTYRLPTPTLRRALSKHSSSQALCSTRTLSAQPCTRNPAP